MKLSLSLIESFGMSDEAKTIQKLQSALDTATNNVQKQKITEQYIAYLKNLIDNLNVELEYLRQTNQSNKLP